MRRFEALIIILAGGLAFAGCEKGKTQGAGGGGGGGGATGGGAGGTSRPSTIDQGGGDDVRAPVADDLAVYLKDVPGTGNKLYAKFETTLGTINCELFPEKAPMTVANFIGLALGKKPWMHPRTKEVQRGVPYFDGLGFHRVIPNFMVQGGDPLGQGVGGPGYKFEDELSPDMDMGPGTLAMANAGPITNGSQFFIMDNTSRPDLAQKHSIFGMCKELDVVAKITSTPRGPRDKPQTPVTMKVFISKG